jgi:very-short-patch-repair endonuclease
MIEEADRKQLLHSDQLREMLERSGGHHGGERLRALTADFTVALPTRSELEDRCLELLRSAGVPQPRVNAAVAGYEVDLYWPAQRFAIELDGYAFHRGRAQARRDRRKEEALDRAGIALRRFDWWQVTDDGSDVVAAVRRGLAREDAT